MRKGTGTGFISRQERSAEQGDPSDLKSGEDWGRWKEQLKRGSEFYLKRKGI
jgi:hypothetical protein